MKKNIRPSEDALGGSEKEWSRRGKEEAEANGEMSQARRGEVREVATMVKRLKRSTEESARECKAEAEPSQVVMEAGTRNSRRP